MAQVVFDKALGEAYLARLRERGVETRSLVVRQNGQVVFEHATAPFELDHVHPLFSVTKSFTSVAVGMLAEEGVLDIQKPWISWFPEYEKDVADPRFDEVTVRNLLTMTMGQDMEPLVADDDDWARGVVGKGLAHDPGEVFFYDSMCSHLLSMLVQRVSGKTLSEFVSERVFEPLGITRWWWEKDRHGHNTGGFGLHLATPDLARFGQCLLDGGAWQGKQVIPAHWVSEATRRQVETAPSYPKTATEDRNGYGYQFWMCAGGGFRCAGLFGQLCYVRPEDGLVVAASSSTTGSKVLLDPLYEVLDEARAGAAAPVDKAKPGSLDVVPTVPGAGESPYQARVLGTHALAQNPYGFDALEVSRVPASGDDGGAPGLKLVLSRGNERFGVTAGHGVWEGLPEGEGVQPIGELFPFITHSSEVDEAPGWDKRTAFCSFAWVSPTTLAMQSRELDQTRRVSATIAVDGNHLVCIVSVEGAIPAGGISSFMLLA